MADDSVYADLLSALSPVSAAGLDPDDAAADRAGTMRTLLGPDDTPKANWYDPPVEEAQNNPPPRPGMSQNGNPLPPGLQVRQPGVPTPDSPPIGSGAPAASSTDGTLFGSPNELQSKTPEVPAGVTPSGNATAPPDLAGANAATIALGQSAYGQSLKDVDAMAAQPAEDQDPAVLKAQQAQANYAVPTNPEAKDPVTGKSLYKMSPGQKIMLAARTVGSGGINGPANYSKPNAEYDYTEQARKARETLAGTQLKQAQDAWTAAQKKASEVAAARSKNVTDLPDATSPSIAQQKVPQDQQKLDQEGQPKTLDEAIAQMNAATDPTKKAQLQATVKQMQSAALQLKPPRQPGDHPSAELQRYEDLKSAAVRENGGKPLSADQLAKISTDLSLNQKPEGAIPQNLADKIKARKDTAMKTAQSRLTPDGIDSQGKPYKKEDFVRDMNTAQQAYETSIEDAGGTVNHMEMGDDLNWKAEAPTASAPPATNTPAAPPPPKVGDVRKGYRYAGGPPSDPASWVKTK